MTGRILICAVLVLVAMALTRQAQAEQRQVTARISYYFATGSPTASGIWPVEGITVACSYDLPLGSRVEIDGRQFVCQDRGHLAPTHLDVYCETAECVRWAESLWPVATATVVWE